MANFSKSKGDLTELRDLEGSNRVLDNGVLTEFSSKLTFHRQDWCFHIRPDRVAGEKLHS